MVEDAQGRKLTSQLEGRWIAFITAIALFFGGWWLQNQYQMTLRLQTELSAFYQRVDDKYVEKDYLAVIAARLSRIEQSLDALHAHDVAEKRNMPPGPK